MIAIPKNITQKEMFAFLKANKQELIKQKSAFPVKSDSNSFPYQISRSTKKSFAKKDIQQVEEVDLGQMDIVAIGNSANWIDSQMDMLLPDCWKKTIKESGPSGKDRIYHLRDHKQETSGVIGKPASLYSKDYALADLGLDGYYGSTQCLVMESIVMQSLNEKCFTLYSEKMINQHSIGMQYIKLDLAINDANSPAEFDVWNKYFAQVINKDVATSAGYFWVVYEIKLLEVSAVLWGSNELTPCIEDSVEEIYTGKSEPDDSTQKDTEPPLSTQKSFTEMLSEMENIVKI